VISRALILVLRMVRLSLVPFESMTSITPRLCKYEPTCSHYAEQAIRTHGPIKGLVLAGWRVLRCHPWSRGGYDPVARP
jgi:putative membrane protein insertion efficiency factor